VKNVANEINAGSMGTSDGRRFDNLSFNELHAGIRRQNSGFTHAFVLIYGEEMFGEIY
jgi:hypothetical protein